LQLGFARVVTTITCRYIGKRRNVDLTDAQFFYRLEELCASSRFEGCTREGADNPVRILGKRESNDPEFQKGYLKPIDEEPTGVMPNAMEKFVSELPRTTEIVALFQNINEAGPLTGARVERSA
jgi:hypothetical protein